MKEVLTKSFWQGVKKTFYEALEEPPKTPQGKDHEPDSGQRDAQPPAQTDTPHPS